MEPQWNPFTEEQAEDRVHRLGQTAETVMIYRLIVKDTIEEWITFIQHKKLDTARTLLNKQITVERIISKKPTKQDLQEVYQKFVQPELEKLQNQSLNERLTDRKVTLELLNEDIETIFTKIPKKRKRSKGIKEKKNIKLNMSKKKSEPLKKKRKLTHRKIYDVSKITKSMYQSYLDVVNSDMVYKEAIPLHLGDIDEIARLAKLHKSVVLLCRKNGYFLRQKYNIC